MKRISKYISEQIYLFIFIIVVGVGLIAAVIILSDTVSKISTSQGESSIEILEISQSKINRINSLETSDNTSQVLTTVSSGRTSPFSE